MSPRDHALVIGKFYPPHAGHHLLIDTAAAQCQRVSVVVMAASHESIALETRVAWLKEVHATTPHVTITGIMDDIRVDLEDPSIWRAHVDLMRLALVTIGAPPVSCVFTSEHYGVELARHFDAVPVTVDMTRALAPVSATAIRANPAAHWDFLAPPVKAGLALKVVVVGAESTGTTTLSLQLLQALRARGGPFGATRWVEEYGRRYTVDKLARARASAQLDGRPQPGLDGLTWTSHEFNTIALQQCELAQREGAVGGPVLVCDTDAFATAIWHERYMGAPSDAVEAIAEADRGALYVMTSADGVPFEQDGLRDGESIRGWMSQRFIERLAETGRRHIVASGSPARRLQSAIGAVDDLVTEGWRFASPVGA